MPLFWLSLATVAGVAAGSVAEGLPWPPGLAAAAGCLILAVFARNPRMRFAFLVLALIFIGASRQLHHGHERSVDSLAPLRDSGAIGLRGRVELPPETLDATSRWVLAVDAAIGSDGAGWQKLQGSVLVSSRSATPVRYGDVVELQGKLQAPAPVGQFDYGEYLAQRGVRSVMRYPRIEIVQEGQGNPALSAIFTLRDTLAGSLQSALPEPHSALAQGIALGIRTGIPREINEDFKRTATTHILAVSGHNLNVVTGILVVLVVPLAGRRNRLFGFAFLAFVWSYALLSGLPASIIRAAFMATLLLGAGFAGRQYHPALALGLSSALMTLADPGVLRDLGFQLSVLALAGILFIAPPIQHALWSRIGSRLDERPWGRAVAAVTIAALAGSIGAEAAALPVQAVNFGSVPFVALPATLFALPVLAVILPLALATALAGMLSPLLAAPFAAGTWLACSYLLAVVHFWAQAPGASLQVPGVTSVAGAVYLGLLAGALWLVHRRPAWSGGPHVPGESEGMRLLLRAAGSKTTVAAFGAAVLLLALGLGAWAVAFSRTHRDVTVRFLDVGQGDAILVTTASGQRVLIDGGPSPGKLLNHLGQALPFWDRSIDLVVLTHPQRDHLTGLLEVVKRYQVGGVVEGGIRGAGAEYAEFERLIENRGVRRLTLAAGSVLRLDGAELAVLHPTPEALRVFGRSVNDASLVLRLRAHGQSVLLTGDIEAPAERWLLAADGPELETSVLKLAHHGSRTSSSEAFLGAVAPNVAVISVGADNPFGHPSPEIEARLRALPVLRTDRDGTVEVRITPEGAVVRGSRPR
ncbi:MAG: ComEC family competence protein [Dehalococcoidia bacterium]|nr:ComEC family competence protein [Dehalococcoidia bacterium]